MSNLSLQLLVAIHQDEQRDIRKPRTCPYIFRCSSNYSLTAEAIRNADPWKACTRRNMWSREQEEFIQKGGVPNCFETIESEVSDG